MGDDDSDERDETWLDSPELGDELFGEEIPLGGVPTALAELRPGLKVPVADEPLLFSAESERHWPVVNYK